MSFKLEVRTGIIDLTVTYTKELSNKLYPGKEKYQTRNASYFSYWYKCI